MVLRFYAFDKDVKMVLIKLDSVKFSCLIAGIKMIISDQHQIVQLPVNDEHRVNL